MKLSYIIVLVVLNFAVNIIADESTDESPSHLSIGYDNGISLRYYHSNTAHIGIILSGSNGGRFGGTYYSTYYETGTSTSDSITHHYSTNRQSKGLSVLAQIGKSYSKGRFVLTPYSSIGYAYSVLYDDSHYSGSGDIEVNIHSLIGEIGIMPGYQYKPFQVEFKLGISGAHDINFRKDKEGERLDFKTKRTDISLIYPNEILQSIIVHYNF